MKELRLAGISTMEEGNAYLPSFLADKDLHRPCSLVTDGRLKIRYKGRSMPYRTFDKIRCVQETAVVENKRLGGLLALIRQSQKAEPQKKAVIGVRLGAIKLITCLR